MQSNAIQPPFGRQVSGEQIVKVIPKPIFQIIALGLLLLIIALAVSWSINETGLFPAIRDLLGGVLGDVDNESLLNIFVGFFTFTALAIPWMVLVLILREYTHGMATMKDEFAILKGQPLPAELDLTPKQTRIVQGIFCIVFGIVLIFINLLVLDATDGTFFWVLALGVPVSIILGIVYLAQGLAMKDK